MTENIADECVYFAVNPDLLDENIWSYRQLQVHGMPRTQECGPELHRIGPCIRPKISIGPKDRPNFHRAIVWQCLAKRVGVKANGSRAVLVERLQQWHKNGNPAVGTATSARCASVHLR